ncbi:unnamed protein product [Caenorhabditis angaria]|uniref:Uncharacterized protein n=1 Tax=Caenorhabditis angaria TaxID=860376 RepID=A0A9P1J0X2_9PELO|nr:unnamed protein product [Caenorhabditis angaria]
MKTTLSEFIDYEKSPCFIRICGIDVNNIVEMYYLRRIRLLEDLGNTNIQPTSIRHLHSSKANRTDAMSKYGSLVIVKNRHVSTYHKLKLHKNSKNKKLPIWRSHILQNYY